jgi:hypothetical protein
MADASDRRPDQRDLDSLFDWLLAFAQQTLERYGEFYPFGTVLDWLPATAGLVIDPKSVFVSWS